MDMRCSDAHACAEYNQLSRRGFLAVSGAAALAAAAAPAWLPRVALAKDLRGGADGLSMCVPWFDDAYYTSRPTQAVARPHVLNPDSAIDLRDGRFGLN